MTKEEKIKEAWGEYFACLSNKTKQYILLNNGQVNVYLLPKEDKDMLLEDNDIRRYDSDFICTKTDEGTKFMFRPKSLKGIEDNNGWISLSGEPNEIEWVVNLELYNIKTKEHYFCTDENEFIEIGRFTHYKPIVKSLEPLY